MTEIGLNVIFNVSEYGRHLRCSTTRSKSSCNFGVIISCPLMFLDSIFEWSLLEVRGTVNYDFVFWVLVELLPSLPVPSKDHVLRALEKMGLVRPEDLQFLLDLHHHLPQ